MISLPINPFLANQPVMGPQPPPGYQPPPRQILPNLSSILSAAPAAESAPAAEPTPEKSLYDQYVDLHRGGMNSFEAFEKVGMKKFGKNTWVDPQTGRGLHINPSDLDYADPGSIIEFFGWDRPEYRQEGLTKVTRVFDPTTDPIRDKRSKEQIAYFDSIKNGMSNYLSSPNIKTSWENATDQQKLDAYDYGLREHGRKTQTRGDGFFSKALGFVKKLALGALPAIAGGIVAGPVGAAVAGGVSKGVKGGLTDGLLGAATGYLGGVGLNKLAPDLSNLAGIGTSGLGGDIGLLNTLQSVGLPVTDASSLGLGGLENVSNVPGDALFDTSVANQIATGSGVGAGALGPTDVLANAITPNLANYAAAAAPALNPFAGLEDLSSGGGFVNPGALGGTTLDQIANTLDTTLPLSDIAPSLMGPQPPPGFYDTLEKAKTLADLGGTVTDLFSEQPEQGGMLSAPSFSFPGSGSQGTPYRSIQFPTGWGRVPTFNLFGNPFQRG